MDGHAMSMKLVLAFGLSLCAGALFAAGDLNDGVQSGQVVATLDKDQVKEFAAFVHARDLRREERFVVARLWREKQGELKGFVQELSQEFGLAPEQAYTYEIDSKSLFQLMTNKLDKAGNPEKKLIRKVQSDSEAQYLSRLMVARKLTEQQLNVLVMLNAEKAEESKLLDEKVRKRFGLDPEGGYRLDEKSGQVFRVPQRDTAQKPVTGVDPVTEALSQDGHKKQ